MIKSALFLQGKNDLLDCGCHSHGLPGSWCPLGVNALSIRGVSASSALANSVSLADISRGACGASHNTVARF